MEYFYAILTLLSGLGAFLVGCKLLSENMEKLANGKIKDLFAKTSKNKFIGVLIGFSSTALVQSSGLTTIMVVGFVNSGIMTLFQATAVIMGANIGTTVTAQLASLQSFKVAEIAMACAGIGVFMTMFGKKSRTKSIGNVITGIGLIFVGLHVMSDSMAVVKDNANVISFLSKLDNPFLLFAIGIVFTALVQSSSVVTSIVITMAASGLAIGNGGNAVLYLILGTNIGSCATALLSSIGTNTNAKRASIIHLMFNVFGAVLFFIMLLCWPRFMETTFEPMFNNPAVQIAMFHTFFNLVCTLIFVPFINVFVALSKKFIKGKDDVVRVSMLEKRFLQTPAIAIDSATKESMKMLDLAIYSLEKSLDCFVKKNEDGISNVLTNNKEILHISQEITNYLILISASSITIEDEKYVSSLHTINGNIVRISELADNVCKYTSRTISEKLVFSDKVQVDLMEMLDTIKELYHTSQQVLLAKNVALISKADMLEDTIDLMRKELVKDHIDRLNRGECRAENSSVFINLVCNLERVGDHLSYIAHSIDSI